MARYQAKPDIYMSSGSKRIRLDAVNEFTPEEIIPMRDCLYYAINDYSSTNKSIIVYIFDIERQTDHYYYLKTGVKLSKKLNGRTYKKCPIEAIHAATLRAAMYLEMQTYKLQEIRSFVAELKDPRNLRNILAAQHAIEQIERQPEFFTDLLEV